jgi:hypothetical protein
MAYLRQDLQHEWGSASFVAAVLERLDDVGVDDDDRQSLDRMLLVVRRIAEALPAIPPDAAAERTPTPATFPFKAGNQDPLQSGRPARPWSREVKSPRSERSARVSTIRLAISASEIIGDLAAGSRAESGCARGG